MMKRIIFLALLFTSFVYLLNADEGSREQDKRETEQKIIDAGVKPIPIKQVNPAYPDSARRSGIEGMVHVQVLVGEKGFVKEVKVLMNESGSELLENAAMKAALDWQFQPVIKDGKAVGVYVTLPFNFKLWLEDKNK